MPYLTLNSRAMPALIFPLQLTPWAIVFKETIVAIWTNEVDVTFFLC
jgi:hypothetical protein